MLCSILFLSLVFDVLTDHFYWCPSCRQKAETLTPECFFPKFFPDFRILFFQQPAAGTFICIDKFTEFRFRLCTKHYMHMVNIMIPFLQNNSIPWILSPNKRSFFIFCNSSPTCRGRRIFIRLYIFLQFHSTADAVLNKFFSQICIQAKIKVSGCSPHTMSVIAVVICTEFFIFLNRSFGFSLGDILSLCHSSYSAHKRR